MEAAQISWYKTRLFWIVFLLLCAGLLNACRPQETASLEIPSAEPSATVTSTLLAAEPQATATRILELGTVLQTTTPTEPAQPATPTATSPEVPLNTPTSTPTQVPVSAPTPTSSSGQSQGTNIETYPGINQPAYPGVEETGSSYPGETSGIFGASGQVNPTLPPPTPTANRFTPLPTTALATPTRQATSAFTPYPITPSSGVFKPLVIPPGGASPVIEIWHALEGRQLEAIVDIVRSFQEANPQVSLILTYLPLDDLRRNYATAAYQDRGPDLLLAPSGWNAGFASQDLVADFSPYFTAEFWQQIAPPALESGRFKGEQTGLPYTMSGVVLYRNRQVIPQPAASLDLLEQSAQKATRGGVIGAYFDLGAFYSMAFYDRMGGSWLDEAGRPTFNRQGYSQGSDWLVLLANLDRIGAVEVNTERDSSLFMQGRVGYILDGTWSLRLFADALGAENLAVDPWPAHNNGRLSGYLQTQSLYLNAATASLQDARLVASLQFAGAMLSPQAQRRLAESGSFPVHRGADVPDSLMRQAIDALQDSVALPPALEDPIREIYWTALEGAIRRGLGIGTQPSSFLEVLRQAYLEINQRLSGIVE